MAVEAAIDRAEALVVSAEREIAFPAPRVYALLTDLRRHWPLLGADLVEAGMVDGGEEGAELVVRGPIPGIERRVVTRVTYARENEAFGGEAVVGRTIAEIDWRLDPVDDETTVVSLSAAIEPGGRRDRLLVAAVRPWLARRCGQILARLEQELAADAANPAA